MKCRYAWLLALLLELESITEPGELNLNMSLKLRRVSLEVALRTFYRFSATSNQDVKLSKLLGMIMGECWW